jgi:tetratricopeptide (TPR) repeat protein
MDFCRKKVVHSGTSVLSGCVAFWLALFAGLSTSGAVAAVADVAEANKLFNAGKYSDCITLAETAIAAKERDEDWPILLTKSLLMVGRYPEAQTAASDALKNFFRSIRLRLVAREAFLSVGQVERGESMLQEIVELLGSRNWAYRDPPNLVALGQAALLLGNDPRRVLDQFFDVAKKANPDYREAYLASGELALNKGDFQLAAKAFQEGLKRFPEDADMHLGLARAYLSSERPQMVKSLQAALRFNTNHVPSLLLLADHMIDAEEYSSAEETLAKVQKVNPWNPDAWAYRAVIEHLRGDAKGEAKSHETALHFWTTNPRVEFLIGRKVSQKYRFTEGAEFQRRALAFDANYLPAKIQLAQDLLRLGEESEGWRLAGEVHERDAYDVVAYNLVTLHDSMAKFRAVTNSDFVLRMGAHESQVYGDRALALLQKARTRLCQKYGIEVSKPVVVEIFPEQKDFGVRTFGMPENPGFLGVCFGSVITANSPASQTGHPANWEAVLWHEFCHVVTLQMTRNKMPRWLSEGISVYEEKRENPAWGQEMNPRYREMILKDEVTPVSELSAAFLTPKSDLHLQFAYYESSLVVEFLVQKFEMQALKDILIALRDGTEINEAIEKHTAPMEKIEKEFVAFVRERAEQLAPELDWEKPKPDAFGAGEHAALPDLATRLTKNFWELTQQAKKLIAEKKWEDAKRPLKKIIEFYPSQTGADNASSLLAEVYRRLNETEPEREVLTKLATQDADAVEAFLRLMELGSTAKDWKAVARNAERYIAVNPLVPGPYRYLAQASEALEKAPQAIQAYRVLLLLDPPDPAETNFNLAQLLHRAGDPAAKRHLLLALEEAPRFREALRLLLEMNDGTRPAKANGVSDPDPKP